MVLDTANETLREKTLDAAKRHKASWIELGQYLYSIHKDKLYKAWGFLAFETYCKKELGIKESTAAKLLKSYLFLEKEEPKFVKPTFIKDEETAAAVPHYESVNLLRLAKQNQKITPGDYTALRKSVIDNAREPKEVRAQVRQVILSQAEAQDPAEVRRTKRNTAIKRLVTTLSNTSKELEREKLIPGYLVTQIQDLVAKLEDQIEE